ncbi:MAG: RluA family pseudouridine synthase [Clostridia bacterium]|nr:RluA family pseudouridine synthase [Clostridia bacterium]MBR4623674.1 RluA family pseudouridine synthase [Clostridia bacterium]MBR6134909.1 RluA family pseudouridine synthase [Clostridia bacterium]MBR6822813.1 RluA family pseudouridine synthase [Clostridia bacterium]
MINVLYEDNHIIVVEKPPMMPVQADSSGDEDLLSVLKRYIREKYHKPGNVYLGLVHRLDRPVGGLMVFARTSKAAGRLSEQIRQNGLKKGYTALVHGETPESGTLEDYLLKEEGNFVRVCKETEHGARFARLDFKKITGDPEKSLLDIILITGRPHQIRVQFSSRGYPIYGDMRYGKGEIGRIALYSSFIGFTHPVTGQEMEFRKKPYGGFFDLVSSDV